MDNWTRKEKTGTDICPAGIHTMEYATTIAKKQNNIFLSATITGNLQLIRLEHIGYFRYGSNCKQWEAVLCDGHILRLKRNTNSQMILDYHANLIQINQSLIVNIAYLVFIKDDHCILLPPFNGAEDLHISKPFLKKLKDRFPSI